MYNGAKKLLSKIISTQTLQRHEVALRGVYAAFYSGDKHQCTVCNIQLRTFLQLPNADLLCPKCGSLSRDRRLWQLINDDFLKPGFTVLDFSPSRSLARNMKKLKDITYMPTDLSGNFIADFRFDITKLDLANNSIDRIICYHVLEHIDDDHKAMTELFRVLKPGGKGLIQTPFKDGEIYENPAITSPQEREVHFGQDDHVRIYSVAGLQARLESTGFIVAVKTFDADNYHGLAAGETVFLISKP